jgi:peptidoglycan/LPS O-acetylase OafA/YrhL
MRPRTLPALTGLRFPLALAVLLFHYASEPAKTAYFPIAGIIGSGFAAVSAFFVLSGYILSYTYVDDSGTLRGSRWAFWSARFARVYPIYLLSLFLIYQAYLMTEERGLWSIVISTVSSLTLTQAWIPSAALSINSAGWSLSVEAFLYLCFPSLLFLVGTGTKRLITLLGLCCGVSLAPALLFVIAQHGGDALTSLVRYNPLFHLGSFVTGMAMERLTRYRQLPAWAGWLSLASIGTVFATGRAIPYEILNNGLLALPFAVLIGRLASSMNPLSSLLGSRPMVHLGDASYCLYILHLPLEVAVLAINEQTLHFKQASWGFVAEAVVFCVVVSLVVFRTIEDPYRRRIREYLRKCAPAIRISTARATDAL